MIMRRLAQSLKEQNWTAIAIEFVLLVLGVFLGIQAQRWQSEIEGRRSERAYLQRMLNDVDLSIQTNELNIARLKAIADGQGLVVSSLVGCDLPKGKRDAFADGLSDLAKVGPSVFVMNTMDEMLSAGKFSLIGNSTVRDEMNGLARDAKYQNNIFTAIHAQLAAAATTTNQRVVWTYQDYRTPFDPVAWGDLSIDFTELCEDRAFQAAVSTIRYLTNAQISLNQRAIAAQREAKIVLERELGLASTTASSSP
jgi:hypothetical protein